MVNSKGGVLARRPSLVFDHAQIAVADLEEAAQHYEKELGLTALTGGHHPGRGTANRIIPLGNCYLELIAVVDAEMASRIPGSMRVAAAASGTPTLQQVRSLWDQIRLRAEEKHKPLKGLLSRATVDSVDDGSLVIGVGDAIKRA